MTEVSNPPKDQETILGVTVYALNRMISFVSSGPEDWRGKQQQAASETGMPAYADDVDLNMLRVVFDPTQSSLQIRGGVTPMGAHFDADFSFENGIRDPSVSRLAIDIEGAAVLRLNNARASGDVSKLMAILQFGRDMPNTRVLEDGRLVFPASLDPSEVRSLT